MHTHGSEEGRVKLSETLRAPEEYSPHFQAIEAQRSRILRDCKKELTGDQLLILILRYEHDRTFSEIAAQLGVSEVTVWKKHQRILRILVLELAGRNVRSCRDL